MHKKIIELSDKRIKFFLENLDRFGFFYKGHETYIEGIKDELKEVEDELKENNAVYLEDELGDIFWTYICLLHSLKEEWKITSIEKVFERCYKKFSERIGEDASGGEKWKEIKEKQKAELKQEHEEKYWNL